MHRGDLIKQFIDKVNNEAEAAAQKVFDSYQDEFETLLTKQKLKGKVLIQAMGSALYNNVEFEDLTEAGEKFLTEVAQAQYTTQRAGFTCRDIN